VLFEVTSAVGESEAKIAVEHAIKLKNRGFTPKSIGADKGYRCQGFVTGRREHGIAPHAALCEGENAGRMRRGKGYVVSQIVRKRIEEIFGWAKTIGGLRRTRYRGVERSHAAGQYVVASLNLLRMAKLMLTAPPNPGWA
jgi:IS5 family transposase